MDRQVERLEEQFVVADGSGKRFQALHYQTFIVIEMLDGSRDQVKGSGRYCLVDGSHLNTNDDGSFTNIQTNAVLRRV